MDSDSDNHMICQVFSQQAVRHLVLFQAPGLTDRVIASNENCTSLSCIRQNLSERIRANIDPKNKLLYTFSYSVLRGTVFPNQFFRDIAFIVPRA
jgi:hypothetical protein